MTSVPAALAQLKTSLATRDRARVNTAARDLIRLRASLGGQWRAIATVLIENGELSDARRAIDLLVAASGSSPLGRFAQAEVYARTGQAAEAQVIMKGVPNDVPDPLGNAYFRGTLATNLGDFDAARDHLRRAVDLVPQSGRSWLALAMTGRVSSADGAAMLGVERAMATAPLHDRGAYFYALGKFHHDHGDHDRAFAAYATGASAESVARRAAPGIDREAAAAAQEGWTAAALGSLSCPRRNERAIFVTGLPRSGTTLVEQILAAHSAVVGGEELSVVRHVVDAAGGVGVPAVAAVGADRLRDARSLYDHLLAERFPGTGRVIDKTLLASRHMGVIATLMPDAPIVWLRRDPLDNAWSIFHTYFHAGLRWSFDLRSIAEQMRLDDALHAHWAALRPNRVLTVDYQALVREPEAVIPQIVAHCGLTLEPQQLRPHENRRTVTTASVAQVRTPINTQAIGAASPYRAHLAPFLEAYG